MIGSLERVYGAITHYLAHSEQVDAYLKKQERRRQQEGAKQELPDELADRIRIAREDRAGQRS
jgi:hypothetical protein